MSFYPRFIIIRIAPKANQELPESHLKLRDSCASAVQFDYKSTDEIKHGERGECIETVDFFLGSMLCPQYNGVMSESEIRLKERLMGIYSEITIDHIIHPQNIDSIPNPDGFAASDSGCGEIMKIWLKISNNTVENAGFWTNGCAATIACGSMSTVLAIGKSVNQALGITARNIADALTDFPEGNFHCAELAADTLRVALKDHLSIQQQPWKKLYRK
jgi:nitrogen fixation protein NifU and related proteins